MASWFLALAALVALVLVASAWSVLVAMRRASMGRSPVRASVRCGQPGEKVALRLTLSSPHRRGTAHVKAIAVEGDLARVLDLHAPRGFVSYVTGNLRYEDFEPDLEAISDRLDEERPRTIEVSRLIEELQREQFDDLQKRREEIDAVQFTGNVAMTGTPLELELPGRPIPEAAGRIWISTSQRIGAATIDDVVMLELPLELGAGR